jgi:hypothetical protein
MPAGMPLKDSDVGQTADAGMHVGDAAKCAGMGLRAGRPGARAKGVVGCGSWAGAGDRRRCTAA